MGTMNRGHLGHFLGQKDVQVAGRLRRGHHPPRGRQEDGRGPLRRATKNGTYKGCAAYNDFRELLARKDIDAVVIATPDHWHAIPCIEACKAGKDIYCEKPLTLTIHEAQDADRRGPQARARLPDRQPAALESASSARPANWSATAGSARSRRSYVGVGGPSKPCDLPEEKMEPGLDWDLWLGPAPKRPYNSVLSPRGVHKHFPNWRNYREYSGGMMTDWGAHHFDIAQWGLGMDESGPVEIIPPDDPKADDGRQYIYANGVEMIHGDRAGGVHVHRHRRRDPRQPRQARASKPDEHHQGAARREGRASLQVARPSARLARTASASRKRPICDVEIGARSVTVCHLGNLAYWNHRKLRWDPKDVAVRRRRRRPTSGSTANAAIRGSLPKV